MRAGLPGQLSQRLGQVRRRIVDLAHGLHVQGAQRGLAGLDPPQLRLGPLQQPGGHLHGQPGLVAQVTQVLPEHAPGYG